MLPLNCKLGLARPGTKIGHLSPNLMKLGGTVVWLRRRRGYGADDTYSRIFLLPRRH